MPRDRCFVSFYSFLRALCGRLLRRSHQSEGSVTQADESEVLLRQKSSTVTKQLGKVRCKALCAAAAKNERCGRIHRTATKNQQLI